ncbi:MAG: hypothetical protein V6Z86_09420 [Hyphomicrobiales bacterium]
MAPLRIPPDSPAESDAAAEKIEKNRATLRRLGYSDKEYDDLKVTIAPRQWPAIWLT